MVESGGVAIRALEDEAGLRVTDLIDRRGVDLQTGGAFQATPADANAFPYPVDAAVAFTDNHLSIPGTPAVYIYDSEGKPLQDLTAIGTRELEADTYFVQFETTLKIYIKVEGQLSICRESGSSTVSLHEPSRIQLGARRHHERPAGTITTSAEPEEVMFALSHLGSSLKTASPRRSYPSLRGHPPAIELGQEPHVPTTIDSPDSGIRVELPAELNLVYVAASLAYYLPADLVVGNHPRLVTENGFSHDLIRDSGFEAEVERVLKQTFFLDCVTREEITTSPLVEREEVADPLPFDLEDIRDLDPAARLEQYLEPPFECVSEVIPTWKQVAHVQPTPEAVEILPYVINDLAVIKTPTNESGSRQSASRGVPGSSNSDSKILSRRGGQSRVDNHPPNFVEMNCADSIEQTWVGDGIPIGASKAVREAFLNRTGRQERDDELRIAIVCNDDDMVPEGDAVADVYGSREEDPFEVKVYENTTRNKLRTVLEGNHDFLHYVGHIDETGFECVDGNLDAETLHDIGIDSFVLNACQSYWQGLALIEAGAIGGVVTLDDVINSGAIRVGKTIARLLNQGFPLRPALMIARKRSVYGNQYLVVGDGNFDIATNRGLGPTLTEVRSLEEDYELEISCYPTRIVGMGSLFRPFLQEKSEQWFLASSNLAQLTVEGNELRTYLDRHVHPVIFDGELTWSDRIDLEE